MVPARTNTWPTTWCTNMTCVGSSGGDAYQICITCKVKCRSHQVCRSRAFGHAMLPNAVSTMAAAPCAMPQACHPAHSSSSSKVVQKHPAEYSNNLQPTVNSSVTVDARVRSCAKCQSHYQAQLSPLDTNPSSSEGQIHTLMLVNNKHEQLQGSLMSLDLPVDSGRLPAAK
jgi:hypothetical protein